MLADFYISRLYNDMKLAVQKSFRGKLCRDVLTLLKTTSILVRVLIKNSKLEILRGKTPFYLFLKFCFTFSISSNFIFSDKAFKLLSENLINAIWRLKVIFNCFRPNFLQTFLSILSFSNLF